MHGARQDRLNQGKGSARTLAQRLDHSLRRRRPEKLERRGQGAQAAGGGQDYGHSERGEPGPVQRQRLSSSTLPVGRSGHRNEPGGVIAGIEGLGVLTENSRQLSTKRELAGLFFLTLSLLGGEENYGCSGYLP